MLERNQPGYLNPHGIPTFLNAVGSSVRGAFHPQFQFQPTIQWFFADKGAGEVDTLNTYGATPTFTRATTATTVNSSGTIISVASGTPRSYYDPSTLSYLGYLAEGARTNICLQSEDLGTTWANAQSTESLNATTAPDGAVTADKLVESADAASVHNIQQAAIAITANTGVTFSVFLKAGERTKGAILFWDGTADGFQTEFDLGAGTVTAVHAVGGGTATSQSIKAYPNGWYRVTITGVVDAATTSAAVWIYLADAAGNATYDGDGTSGLYIWGAQAEVAAFASSYIPTTTAAVTRNADVLTYPTTGWYSATAGTFLGTFQFPQLQVSTGATALLGWDDASSAESMVLNIVDTTNVARLLIRDGAVEQGPASTANAISVNTNFSVASAYAVNDFAICLNGGTVGTDTSGTLPAAATILRVGLAQADFAYPAPFGPIRRVAYFDKRLSNEHLQILTAG